MASLPRAGEIARRLVRFPTVNPPGDEEAAQRYVASLLESAGLGVESLEAIAGRPNLVTRLAGRGERPPLILHGHVDVVGVDGQEWRQPPFDGMVEAGVLHSRGTLDMKSGVAMLTHALCRAAIDGIEPSGDIVLAVVVDSETGGDAGLAYLVDQHADVFDGAAFAVGEFGGFPLHAFGRRFYRIGVSQKQYAHLRLTLSGEGGHGSRRAMGTVMGRLGDVLARIDRATFPPQVSPVTERVVEAIAGRIGEPAATQVRRLIDGEHFDEALAGLAPRWKDVEALFRDTANATIVRAGEKFSVIPSRATIEVDARIVPAARPPILSGI